MRTRLAIVAAGLLSGDRRGGGRITRFKASSTAAKPVHLNGHGHRHGMDQSALLDSYRREKPGRHGYQLDGRMRQPPNIMLRRGFTKRSLEVGTGAHPFRDIKPRTGRNRANGSSVTFKDGKKLFVGGSNPDIPPESKVRARRFSHEIPRFSRCFVTAGMCAIPAGAQTTSSKKAWTPPKTSWGDPDLQGQCRLPPTFPCSGPVSLGDRAELTDAELAQRESQSKKQASEDGEEFAKGGDVTINPPSYWVERGKPVRQASLVVDLRTVEFRP